MLHEITRFYQDLQQRGIIIGFSGTFSQGINEEVCEALEFYVSHKGSETNLMARLFSVFIEMSQNVRKYFHSKSGDPAVFSQLNNTGAIVIGKGDGRYFVSSVNLLHNSDRPGLERTMAQLLELNAEELKLAYRQRLLAPGPAGSAGMGMIDIARKASEPLIYHFEPRDPDYSFFYLEAVLVERPHE